MQVLLPIQMHWFRKEITTYPLDMFFPSHCFSNFSLLTPPPSSCSNTPLSSILRTPHCLSPRYRRSPPTVMFLPHLSLDQAPVPSPLGRSWQEYLKVR